MGENMTITAPQYPAASFMLRASATLWFMVAAAGQILFAVYLAALYGRASLAGDPAAWNAVMRNGHIEGDGPGNAAMVAHVFIAFLITLGGLAQLTPQIRSAAPAFHRWNGRMYLVLAVATSLAGLFLTWTRPAASGLSNDIAISLNAAVILVCAYFALRHARARRIDIHMRWATRLFFAVSGVWFLRIMVSGWIGANQGPLWLGDRLDGPAGVALGFASYLLPLAVYEVYWRARDHGGAAARLAMAAGLVVITAATAGGIGMAAVIMWLPHL